MLRNRVVELRRVRAETLRPNPRNWRSHPPAQARALRAALDEIGFVGALVARPLDDGTLELVDGHLRAETLPDEELPVLVVDLSSAEADKLLALYDPLAAMAHTNAERLATLMADIQLRHASLRQVVDELVARRANTSLDDLLGRAPRHAPQADANSVDADKTDLDPKSGATASSPGSALSSNSLLGKPAVAPTRDSRAKNFRATYQIVVACESESQQRELYERLTSEGHKCRVLTLS